MTGANWKRDFFTIWAGQAASLIGSQLVQFALVWWLTASTGSATVLATATTISLLPSIFIGPFAGTLVDRWPRKWVLILSDGSIAVATALLSVLFWLDIALPWHVFAILFIRSLGDAFQNPAMMATTPLMVPKDQLTRVAGMNSTLQGILSFASPPLGAMLLELINVRGVLPLDVVTAILAILPLFIIPVPQVSRLPSDGGPKALLGDLSAGLRYVWSWKGLRGLLATSVVMGLAFKPWTTFVPLLASEYFGRGPKELSLMYSAYGISLVAGGTLLGARGGLRRNMSTASLGSAGLAAGALVFSSASPDQIWIAILGCVIVGLGHAYQQGGLNATQQTVIHPQMMGRCFALWGAMHSLAGPISLAIITPVAERWGIHFVYPLAGLFLTLVAIARRFVPAIYRIEDQPKPELPEVAPIVLEPAPQAADVALQPAHPSGEGA